MNAPRQNGPGWNATSANSSNSIPRSIEPAHHTTTMESLVYAVVLVSLGAVGFVTNTLMISVFCRQTYHPTRLILLVMAVANNLFIFSYLNRVHDSPHTFWDYGVYSTIRIFIVQCGPFMTAVHTFWTLYPKHRFTSPFFMKKRMLVCLLVIFLWSIIQSVVEIMALIKVPHHDIVIKFSFQILTITIPPIMQLALVIRLLYILRLRRRRLGIRMPLSAEMGCPQIMASSAQDDSARRGMGRNGSSVESYRVKASSRSATDPARIAAIALLQPGAQGSSSRSVQMPSHLEADLCKVVIVISILPIFSSTLLTLSTGYYRKVARTESTCTTWDKVSVETSDIVQAISASYQFWVFLALVPSFRDTLKLTFLCISCAFSTAARKGPEVALNLPTVASRAITVKSSSDSTSSGPSSSGSSPRHQHDSGETSVVEPPSFHTQRDRTTELASTSAAASGDGKTWS